MSTCLSAGLGPGSPPLVEQLMAQSDADVHDFVSRHKDVLDPVTARGQDGQTLLEKAARAPERTRDRTLLLLRGLGAFRQPLSDDVKFSLIRHILGIERVPLETADERVRSANDFEGDLTDATSPPHSSPPAPLPSSFVESAFTELKVSVAEWVASTVSPLQYAATANAPLLLPHCDNQKQLVDVFKFFGGSVELHALAVAQDPSVVNAAPDGQFPLELVDTVEAVAALLAAGADPSQVCVHDARNSAIPTPLHDCIRRSALRDLRPRRRDPVAVLKVMAAAASDPNVSVGAGATPLLFACESQKYAAFIPPLLDAGVDPNGRIGADGQTVLENLDLSLVPNGFDFKIFDMTALCSTGDPILLYLLKCRSCHLGRLAEHGADPNQRGQDGSSPLEYAVRIAEDPARLEQLLQHCGDRVDLAQPFSRTGLTAIQTLASCEESAKTAAMLQILRKRARADTDVANDEAKPNAPPAPSSGGFGHTSVKLGDLANAPPAQSSGFGHLSNTAPPQQSAAQASTNPFATSGTASAPPAQSSGFGHTPVKLGALASAPPAVAPSTNPFATFGTGNPASVAGLPGPSVPPAHSSGGFGHNPVKLGDLANAPPAQSSGFGHLSNTAPPQQSAAQASTNPFATSGSGPVNSAPSLSSGGAAAPSVNPFAAFTATSDQ